MIFRELELASAWMIEPERHADDRGHFARTFCRKEFEQHGLDVEVVQASVSFNRRAGTLRGLHFQRPPFEEGKLVRCSRGVIFDVMVDLRPDSETLAQWFGATLSSDNGHQLFVPRGFAHGFLTLEDDTEVSYLMSEVYSPDHGAGYRYDDPTFAVSWPRSIEVIAEKDLELPVFEMERHHQLMVEKP